MKRLYLDIETNMAHNVIWCCCCIDDTGAYTYEVQDKAELAELVTKYDEIVAHNGIRFDFPLLEKLWGVTIPANKQRDTYVLSRLIDPQRPSHALKAWGKSLGIGKLDFDVEDFDGGLTEEMVTYCQRDVEVLAKLDKELDRLTSKWKHPEISSQLEHKVAQIMYQQELNGFKLDIRHSTTLLGELNTRMGMIEAELQQVFPPIVTERWSEKTGKQLKDNTEVFNVGSRQQIAKRLHSLGATFSKHTEKGSIIVDEPVLDAIDLPEAKLCLEYLMIQKRVGMLNSWLDKVHEDDRVRGRVITNGAVTGRMTHNSPNMGQITSVSSAYGKESRQCWTVEKGNKLVGCDLSGIELRCLAHYMQDEEWTKELLEGDIHTKNQLAAGLETRAQAKTMIYATLYGAGSAKIGSIVGGGSNRGKQITDNFYKNTPALKSLKERVDRIVSKHDFLVALDGRALQVRHAHAALNTLLQSCGAVIAKQWLVEIAIALANVSYGKHCKQVVMVHDEVQFECPTEFAEQLGKLLVEASIQTGKTLNFRVPIDAEYKIGDTWYDTH